MVTACNIHGYGVAKTKVSDQRRGGGGATQVAKKQKRKTRCSHPGTFVCTTGHPAVEERSWKDLQKSEYW
jgi:hypothetical protein